MVSSDARTVQQYLAELPDETRADVLKLVKLARKWLPKGYVEAMAWGMICYQVPLEVSGPTYNKQPLAVVGIAAQKRHISLYLLSIYSSSKLTEEFKKRWKWSGKKLSLGKSCIRFKEINDADIDTITWALGLVKPKEFVEIYNQAKNRSR